MADDLAPDETQKPENRRNRGKLAALPKPEERADEPQPAAPGRGLEAVIASITVETLTALPWDDLQALKAKVLEAEATLRPHKLDELVSALQSLGLSAADLKGMAETAGIKLVIERPANRRCVQDDVGHKRAYSYDGAGDKAPRAIARHRVPWPAEGRGCPAD